LVTRPDATDPIVPSLVEALADALRARGWMLATAESCTGGLIAAACTALAGSSDWFERGIVSYSNSAKCELLDVPPELIATQGAVSEGVALAMARGALARCAAHMSVAVTGVAGPGGGSPAKLVGTVWMAWARRGPDGALRSRAVRYHFEGDRAAVRAGTVRAALQGVLDDIRAADADYASAAAGGAASPQATAPGGAILLASRLGDIDMALWWPALQKALPGQVLIRSREEATPAELARVDVALVTQAAPGILRDLPALRLVQSLWAGVDRLLADPELPPDVPVARMVDPSMTAAMVQTALWAVLGLHRHAFDYAAQQHERVWHPQRQRRAEEIQTGVLGLGEIGLACAQALAGLGYRVDGWSTRPVRLDGVRSLCGEQGLETLLGQADIVVNLLPLTPATRGLFDTTRLRAMKHGAALVNLARGAHVVEADLLAALDSGHVRHAVLDVLQKEPPAPQHPFWSHPRVTLWPHAAAATDPHTACAVVATNISALRQGRPLRHLVDRPRGY